MSEPADFAIQLVDVGKSYRLYHSQLDTALDALGLGRVLHRGKRYEEFWALRDVRLEVAHGERVGIVGRNGAGKSTLLKLITGNVDASEGTVLVDGAVQALLDMGGGLHPEFTGRENIRASLVYQGLAPDEIEAAEADIAEFTELGGFLDYPLKTYSLGMQGRLAFAIATAVSPDILIVDEILGTGDAYFYAKSSERMRALVESGASVLMVSHALEQITRFCRRAVWLERGRVAMEGPALEVVAEYQRFMKGLEERRLRGRNARRQQSLAHGEDTYADVLRIAVSPRGEAPLAVRAVRLLLDGSVEDAVAVGGPQDASPAQSAYVDAAAGGWGQPDVVAGSRARATTGGTVVFQLWNWFQTGAYEAQVEVPAGGDGVDVTLARSGGGVVVEPATPEGLEDGWERVRVRFHQFKRDADELADAQLLPRFMGNGEMRIVSIGLFDEDGAVATLLGPGDALRLRLAVRSAIRGRHPIVPAALIFREDGQVMTRHVGAEQVFELEVGSEVEFELDYGPLMLGDGRYLVGAGLYRYLDLDVVEPSEPYDWVDRALEFRVEGGKRLEQELVRHPGTWEAGPVEHPQADLAKRTSA